MTLREHFEAIERKLDQLLDLLVVRSKLDPLDEAAKAVAELKQRLSRMPINGVSSRQALT